MLERAGLSQVEVFNLAAGVVAVLGATGFDRIGILEERAMSKWLPGLALRCFAAPGGD